jgi:biotin transporter BioY
MLERSTSFLWTLLSLTTAHLIILFMGMAWLSTFVGWDNSFAAGVAPFIPGTVLKTLAAACLAKPIVWSTKK